jgi:glyoxylase-like metal-dependent hydrolase (beta-lactamase superfamily II)
VVFPVARRKLDRAVREGDSIETPIGPLTVIATPGHSPGHTSYYHEESGWLFSGDALLTVIPFKMKGGLSLPPRIFNHDTPQAVRSLQKLAELRPACLFAGHGRPWIEGTADSIAEYSKSVQAEAGSAR